MQVSERDGGVSTGNGLDSTTASDAQQVSPSHPKPPSLDLFNLVVSYKQLELYLEPLQDVAEGVWFLLRLVLFYTATFLGHSSAKSMPVVILENRGINSFCKVCFFWPKHLN